MGSVYLSFTFPIEDGRISAGFKIPENIFAGDYALRAYTEWSRNYPEMDQFLLALPISDPSFKPKSKEFIQEEFFGEVTICLLYPYEAADDP